MSIISMDKFQFRGFRMLAVCYCLERDWVETIPGACAHKLHLCCFAECLQI